MFLPIGDDQEHERTPWLTYALIGINVAAFVAFCLPQPRAAVVERGALVPSRLRPHTILTSMFLHADLFHLGGNMIFLWLFGRLAEERLRWWGFLAFYLATGASADLLHAVTTAHPDVPTFGASGAVSGAIGAALVFVPHARIKVFVWFWWVTTVEIPAFLWILAWFAEQVVFSSLSYGNVAYYAHIGGFAAGALLALAIRSIFARGPRTPPIEPRAPSRKTFGIPGGEARPVFVDDSVDSWAVVTLEERDPVITRRVSRAEADRLCREFRERGIAAARIADVPANHPPAPEPVHSASWDDRLLRLRVGSLSVPLPWSSPLLFVGAMVGDDAFVDVFAGPQTAYRIRASAAVPLTRVDARKRSETPCDLAEFARERRIELVPFRNAEEYADFLFRKFHLAMADAPSKSS